MKTIKLLVGFAICCATLSSCNKQESSLSPTSGSRKRITTANGSYTRMDTLISKSGISDAAVDNGWNKLTSVYSNIGNVNFKVLSNGHVLAQCEESSKYYHFLSTPDNFYVISGTDSSIVFNADVSTGTDLLLLPIEQSASKIENGVATEMQYIANLGILVRSAKYINKPITPVDPLVPSPNSPFIIVTVSGYKTGKGARRALDAMLELACAPKEYKLNSMGIGNDGFMGWGDTFYATADIDCL